MNEKTHENEPSISNVNNKDVLLDTTQETTVAGILGVAASRELTTPFKDGYYSGSPDFPPEVYGAD